MPPQLKILFPDFLFFYRSLCKPSLKYATEPKTLIHCYMKISPRQNISGCNARLLCKQVGKTKTGKTLSWRNTKRFCILKIIDAFHETSSEHCKTMFAAVKLRNIILLSAVTKRRWTPEVSLVNFPRLSSLIKRQQKVLKFNLFIFLAWRRKKTPPCSLPSLTLSHKYFNIKCCRQKSVSERNFCRTLKKSFHSF